MLDQDDLVMNLMIASNNAFNLSKKRMKDYTAADAKERIAIQEILNG